MGKAQESESCSLCGRSGVVSTALGVCRQCILDSFDVAQERIQEAQARARSEFDLPATPPKDGAQCTRCVNLCSLADGEVGYCGVRSGHDGLVRQVLKGAIVEWYYDPLPTNCVADFVCPGGSQCGYPQYSKAKGAEYGYKNLAVFYGACNFSCLFCQNWQFRKLTKARSPVMSAEMLASKADDKTTCVCYFGGDPTPQIKHAIETSQILKEKEGLMRICFETNGSMNPKYIKEIADLSYSSGGCIKIDLKAFNVNINKALCGTDNRWTLSNFRWLAEYQRSHEDRGFPLLIASTLLVPGYIERDEVSDLANFIASLDPEIPYSLLAFSPRFHMTDLPRIKKEVARDCLAAAKEAGLKRVRLENPHLID